MLIAELLESSKDEMAMYRQVRAASAKVLQTIYRGLEPFKEVEIEGFGDFYVYRSDVDLGLDKVFLLLIGLRKLNTVGMSGMVMKFEPTVFGYDSGVAIYCMRDYNRDEMRKAVNSTGFMKVLEHEFLHVLDNERTADRIIRAVDPKSDSAGYYNSPAEFNAYYHDIAKNILAVIEASEDNPAEAQDYMELYGLTGDWKTDLGSLLTTDYHSRSFVKSLTSERRRALLKRLYRLHQQMMQTVHRPPATSAQTPLLAA